MGYLPGVASSAVRLAGGGLYTTEWSLLWTPARMVWLSEDAERSEPSVGPLALSLRWQQRICLKVALISLSR